MGPLYPYFLAFIYRLFGPDLLIVKLVQSVVGGLTAGMIYRLGSECFGGVAGLIAGFIAALYVPFIFYDNSILFPVLAAFLNTLLLYFLYVGIHRSKAWAFLVSGVLWGLSAAGNAGVLAFAPAAVAFLLLYGKLGLNQRLKRIALVAIGVAIVVGPITVRNYVIGDDFVPLTSNAGLNLYIGNNPQSTGAYVKPDELDVYVDPSGKGIAEAALGRKLKPSEVSAYWTDRAVTFMREQPAAFLSNMLRKVFFVWSVFEVPQIEHLSFERRFSWLLRIPSPSFGVVCPLGIMGIVLALRRKKETWLLFLFIATYAVTITAFFVVARYRLPMLPALMAFSGYAVFRWICVLSERKYRHAVFIGVGFVVLYLLVHVNFYKVDPMSGFAQSYYRLGIIYEKKGQMEDALESHRKAVEIDPSLASARVNLGILLSRKHEYEKAKGELLKAIALDPDYAKAYYNLGLVYSEQGNADSALIAMNKAVELEPDYSLAKVGIASTYYELADLERAEALLVDLRGDDSLPGPSRDHVEGLLGVIPQRRRWLEGRELGYQKHSDRLLLRGDNLLLVNMPERALQSYNRAIAVDSSSAVAHYQAGTIYFNKGEFDQALRYFDVVLAIDPQYKGVHFARGVIAFRKGGITTACSEFEGELRIDPTSSASHINLAMCYEEHLKDYDKAAYHISRYIELTGGTQQLRDHLKELRDRIKQQ
jgi:tetratricopeptide (TPR) repeat protein